jgi:hypothetical protein
MNRINKLYVIKPYGLKFFPIEFDSKTKFETLIFFYYHLKGSEWDFYIDICDEHKNFLKRLAFSSNPKTEIDGFIQKIPKFFGFRWGYPFLFFETFLRHFFNKLRFSKRVYDLNALEIKDGYFIRVQNRTSSYKFIRQPFFNGCINNPKVNLQFPLDATHFYLNKVAAFPDETVSIKISSKKQILNAFLVNALFPEKRVLNFTINNACEQPYTAYMFRDGCNWKDTTTFHLPKNLISGLYAVGIDDGEKVLHAPLVVKSIEPKKILVLSATNTWQAYNFWGGASIYDYFVEDGTQRARSHIINFDRPNPEADPFKQTRSWKLDGQLLANAEVPIFKWLSDNKLDFHAFSDQDLHTLEVIPDKTELVILSNHSEYWSKPMYDALEKHLKRGGHLLNLSGNAIYWKVVIKDRKMEVRKDHSMHTLVHEPGGNWASLGRPESAILGSSYTLKGWHTYAPYKVINANHWLFEGLNVALGQLIGQEGKHFGPASGWECDKRDAFSPPNIEIIAKGTNPKHGGAEWMIHQRPEGGWVMTTSSITFNGALDDAIITGVLKNFFSKLQIHPNK